MVRLVLHVLTLCLTVAQKFHREYSVSTHKVYRENLAYTFKSAPLFHNHVIDGR